MGAWRRGDESGALVRRRGAASAATDALTTLRRRIDAIDDEIVAALNRRAAVAALRDALLGLHDYPDGGAFYLKQALAKKHQVEPQSLIVGNGTNEIIEILARTCLRPGENVVYADPSFIVYKLVPLAMGAEV